MTQGGREDNTFKILVFFPISFFTLSFFIPLSFYDTRMEVRREWRMEHKDIGLHMGDRQL
jgi:hypothetical protein